MAKTGPMGGECAQFGPDSDYKLSRPRSVTDLNVSSTSLKRACTEKEKGGFERVCVIKM